MKKDITLFCDGVTDISHLYGSIKLNIRGCEVAELASEFNSIDLLPHLDTSEVLDYLVSRVSHEEILQLLELTKEQLDFYKNEFL